MSWAEFYIFFFFCLCVLSLIEYPALQESQDRVGVNFRVLFHALR